MSEPERDDDHDQPGGEVVPFPDTRPVPEVVPDAVLEPAAEPLEGEIVGEEEYARRTGVHRYTPTRVVHLVTVVRESERTTGAGRAMLRTGLTVGSGVGSWARRGWDGATLGVYRRQIEAAEAAGDSERLADWTTRREQVRARRHQRLMDAPKLAAGLALVTAGGLVALVVGVLLVGLLVQVSGAGRFLGVLHGGSQRGPVDSRCGAGGGHGGAAGDTAVAGGGRVARRSAPRSAAGLVGHRRGGRPGRHDR